MKLKLNAKTIAIAAVFVALLGAGLYSMSIRGGTNDISQRARNGAKEDELLNLVEKSNGKFNLSANDVLALKKDGVSDDVIIAMIRHNNGEAARTVSAVANGTK
jgi:hypothetical protein